MALTSKQEAFALDCAKEVKATDAYRAHYSTANMSQKTVHEEASRLLANPKVSARIAELRAPALQAAALDVTTTLSQIARVYRFDIRKLYDAEGNLKPVAEWDDETAAAVSHIGRNGPVPFDRLKALDMANRIHGLYEKDNRQKAANIAIQVQLVKATTVSP